MGEKMTLEKVRDELMTQREIEGDKRITEFYERIIAAIDAHLATPAQTVDVEAVREVIAGMRFVSRLTDDPMTRDTFTVQAEKLAQAIGDKT